MNIAMEQTQEMFNGNLKNQYPEVFIRGNNGTSGFASIQQCMPLAALSHAAHGATFAFPSPNRLCASQLLICS